MGFESDNLLQELEQYNRNLDRMLGNDLWGRFAMANITSPRVGAAVTAGFDSLAAAAGVPNPQKTPSERQANLLATLSSVAGDALGLSAAALSKTGPVGSLVTMAIGQAAGDLGAAVIRGLFSAEMKAEKLVMQAMQQYMSTAMEYGIELTDDDIRELVRYLKRLFNRKIRQMYTNSFEIDKAINPFANSGSIGWATSIRPI